MHVPDMQSVPLSMGTQKSPSADFVRQQPTPKPIVLVMAQYSMLLLQQLSISEQIGSQRGRSSASTKVEQTLEILLPVSIIASTTE